VSANAGGGGGGETGSGAWRAAESQQTLPPYTIEALWLSLMAIVLYCGESSRLMIVKNMENRARHTQIDTACRNLMCSMLDPNAHVRVHIRCSRLVTNITHRQQSCDRIRQNLQTHRIPLGDANTPIAKILHDEPLRFHGLHDDFTAILTNLLDMVVLSTTGMANTTANTRLRWAIAKYMAYVNITLTTVGDPDVLPQCAQSARGTSRTARVDYTEGWRVYDIDIQQHVQLFFQSLFAAHATGQVAPNLQDYSTHIKENMPKNHGNDIESKKRQTQTLLLVQRMLVACMYITYT